MMKKVGRQWLLALGGRFLLHLKICSYRVGSPTSWLMKSWELLNKAFAPSESEPHRIPKGRCKS